ncbi:MAG: biotin/lipoyl-containing protein [Ardenticatenales bacterium]
MKITLQIGDTMRSVEAHRQDGRVVIRLGAPMVAEEGAAALPSIPDDAPALTFHVRRGADGAVTLVDVADPAHRIGLAGVADGSDRQLWTDGRTLRYARVVAGGAARHAADDAGLMAAIPSVVLDVLVAAGDAVAAGQKLILLESMKMVVAIQAPHAGVVTAVHCAKGDAVQPGVALLALEAEPAVAP